MQARQKLTTKKIKLRINLMTPEEVEQELPNISWQLYTPEAALEGYTYYAGTSPGWMIQSYSWEEDGTPAYSGTAIRDFEMLRLTGDLAETVYTSATGI